MYYLQLKALYRVCTCELHFARLLMYTIIFSVLYFQFTIVVPMITNNRAKELSSSKDANNNSTVNIIENLSRFFTSGPTSPRRARRTTSQDGGVSSDARSCAKTETALLITIFQDMVHRKGIPLSQLVRDVMHFSESVEKCDTMCQQFVHALLAVYCRMYGDVEQNVELHEDVSVLLKLLWSSCGNFQHVFSTTIPGRVKTVMKSANIKYTPFDLEFILQHGATLHVPISHEDDVPPRDINASSSLHSVPMIDAPLACGETPLILACRHRRPDAVLLLLRHRASVHASWLFFRSALEVLLFSPNTVIVDDAGLRDIELCSIYYQRAVNRVDMCRLRDVEKEGRCALHQGWRELVAPDRYQEPASLRHMCRTTIREHLQHNKAPTTSMINRLQLPTMLKRYVDLQYD